MGGGEKACYLILDMLFNSLSRICCLFNHVWIMLIKQSACAFRGLPKLKI